MGILNLVGVGIGDLGVWESGSGIRESEASVESVAFGNSGILHS